MSDPLNIENWYHTLASVTFRTEFLNLSFQQATALLHLLEDPQQKNGKFTKTDAPNFEQLQVGLDEKMAALKHACAETNGFFVRLSTRSPKDAVMSCRMSDLEKRLSEQLDKLYNASVSDKNSKISEELLCNQEALLMVHCFHEALQVRSGEEAIQLLLGSKRVYHDLSTRLLMQQSEKEFEMVVAVRQWVNIVPGMEFRGFVHDNELRALSQYFQAAYVPLIKLEKGNLEKLILSLFETVKDKLSHIKHYVIDFAQLENGEMIIVELNHFHKTTGAALFDWIKDDQLLHNGPFEFRIIETPIQDPIGKLYQPLRDLLRKLQSTKSNRPNQGSTKKSIFSFLWK